MTAAFEKHADNPYLTDKYAPIFEESTFSDMQVIGEIPKDFSGVFARNSPNPQFDPRVDRHHWFDGDGMMHAMHFQDGKASYRNRWVQTAGLQGERDAGQSLYGGLIQPDFKSPLGPIKDTANTDVIAYNGELIALWYRAGIPYAMDPVTLENLGPRNWSKDHKALPVSAHAKVDEKTGEMLVFNYGPKAPYMHYGVVSKEGELVHWIPVELPGERFPHDMAFTENYSILMDLPVFHNPEAAKLGKWQMQFHRDTPSRFAVVPRFGGVEDIRWFDAEPCYIYHVTNSWEEGDNIIMEGCRTPEPVPKRDPNDAELVRLMKNLQLRATMHRWTFNLKTGECTEEQLDDLNTEFPTINAFEMGRKTDFTYNMIIPKTDTLEFTGIAKYSPASGKRVDHHFGKGCYGSEAPFAPRHNSKSEDDGYLLSFVYDEINQQSECRILDAQHLENEAVARIIIPQRVPLGYHACWAAL